MSAELELRSDLLLRLEEAGALTATGLDLSSRPDLTYAQYLSIGHVLRRATTAIRWAVGDWLTFGEDVFGELAAQASDVLGIAPEARMELIRVAKAIPSNRRRAGLTWTHHRAVASRLLTPAQRDDLLDAAEREDLTANELNERRRELCNGLSLPGKDQGERDGQHEPASRLDICDADDVAAAARLALIDCGYPSDVEVVIRLGSVEVTVGP